MAIQLMKRVRVFALFASCWVIGCDEKKTNERPTNKPLESSQVESGALSLDAGDSVKPQRLMDWVGILEKMMERDQYQNAVFSPASMEIALGVLYLGADDSSRHEMKSALWTQYENSAAIIKFHEKWIIDFNQPTDRGVGTVANSLWRQNQVTLQKEFSNHAKSKYGTDIFLINPDPIRANEDLQEWLKASHAFPTAEFKTGFEQNVKIALFNTIHFKSEWQRAFDKKRSREESFHAPSGAVQRRFMLDNGKYYYEEADLYQAISIPMAEKSTQMYVYLPKVGHSISEVLKSLKADSNAGKFKHAFERNIALKIPAVKTVCGSSWIDFLKNIGIRRIFEADGNPLSNMTQNPSIHVGLVHQQTIFEYDEDGAEGATISHFSMYDTIPSPADKEIDFTVDRPFLYFIQKNGLVLFLGILSNPEK